MSQAGAFRNNPLLRKAFAPIHLTEHQVDEYTKCANDYLYFIRNYMKIINVDSGLINFDMYDYQEDLITTLDDNRFVLVKFPRQAIDLNENILTKDGWRKFAEVKEGDFVYGKNGKLTKIVSVSEIMEGKVCYDVYFDDKSKVRVDADHLWSVNHNYWTKDDKVMTTERMKEYFEKRKTSRQGLYVKINDALEFDEKELPIDPYVFGVWLGDGNSDSASLACLKNDYEEYKNHMSFLSERHVKEKEHIIISTIEGLYSELNKNGILKNKHIPEIYKFSGVDQRISLIQGLMDTDGYVDKKGSCEFYQKNEKIIDDFIFILRSLGVKARKRFRVIKDQKYFVVAFTTMKFDVFRLSRKLNRQKLCINRKDNTRLYVSKIEKVESVKVKCIEVNNEDSLFLIGDNLIPTHNSGKSTTVVGYFLWCLIFNKYEQIAVVANKEENAIALVGRLKLAYERLPLWLQQGVVEWNKKSVELENGSGIWAYATSGDGLRSRSFTKILLDEFGTLKPNLAKDFMDSTFPTISSGHTTKIFIVSTPKGLNHFHEMWEDAERGKSDYVTKEIPWNAVPGRDEEWRKKEIARIGPVSFAQEYSCVSGDTKIDIGTEEITMKELWEKLCGDSI